MKESNIQWCHSTINPVMGCLDECELANREATITQLIKALAKLLPNVPQDVIAKDVRDLLTMHLSEIYQQREELAVKLLRPYGLHTSRSAQQLLIDVIRERSKCYALLLGANRAGNKGYADKFEEPMLFPGRMGEAAQWSHPSEKERAAKPWLGGTRLIFVSDMGDALSRSVPFDFLKAEIIDNVAFLQGQRHTWLWLTKQPRRMAEFGRWLAAQGVAWPDNLVAMTTVTSVRTLGRIGHLLKVPARYRGLSVEPLFGPVELPLAGVDWVIAGGGSDVLADPFCVEWALSIREQCRKAGCAFFLKQLGRNPMYRWQPLNLRHKHGGDWSEWPPEWRVRQFPAGFDRGAYAPAGVRKMAAGS